MKGLNSLMLKLIIKMSKGLLKVHNRLILKKIKQKEIKKSEMMILQVFLYGSKTNFNHLLIKSLSVKKKYQDQLLL